MKGKLALCLWETWASLGTLSKNTNVRAIFSWWPRTWEKSEAKTGCPRGRESVSGLPQWPTLITLIHGTSWLALGSSRLSLTSTRGGGGGMQSASQAQICHMMKEKASLPLRNELLLKMPWQIAIPFLEALFASKSVRNDAKTYWLFVSFGCSFPGNRFWKKVARGT